MPQGYTSQLASSSLTLSSPISCLRVKACFVEGVWLVPGDAASPCWLQNWGLLDPPTPLAALLRETG